MGNRSTPQLAAEIEADPKNYPLLDEGQYPDAYDNLYAVRDAILASGQVDHADDFVWELHIIDDPKTLNAFCAPGGYIYVYTGIIGFLEHEDHLAAPGSQGARITPVARQETRPALPPGRRHHGVRHARAERIGVAVHAAPVLQLEVAHQHRLHAASAGALLKNRCHQVSCTSRLHSSRA